MPPSLNHTCRYGDLFRGAGSPIEALYAGVGTMEDEGIVDDIVPFRRVCATICAIISLSNNSHNIIQCFSVSEFLLR